jgi:tRNA threonylcarbamoyl adenosine modification protein YeaZ
LGAGENLNTVTSTKLPNYSLAIDTSAGTTVALLSLGSVVAEVNYLEPMTHSERIGSAIQTVLKQGQVSPRDIYQVVVGRGPGPFTGLRVGLAAAKFFAIGAKAELVGVCSLDAIAYSYYLANPDQSLPLLVTTDARRKEVFWALYAGIIEGVPIRVEGPSVNKPEYLTEYLSGQKHVLCDLPITASALGQVAYYQALTDIGPSKDSSPIYLREPDAVPGKAKKVSG